MTLSAGQTCVRRAALNVRGAAQGSEFLIPSEARYTRVNLSWHMESRKRLPIDWTNLSICHKKKTGSPPLLRRSGRSNLAGLRERTPRISSTQPADSVCQSQRRFSSVFRFSETSSLGPKTNERTRNRCNRDRSTFSTWTCRWTLPSSSSLHHWVACFVVSKCRGRLYCLSCVVCLI